MENVEGIQINNNILKPGGAVGRLTYFLQALALGLITVIVSGIAESTLKMGNTSNIILFPVALLSFAIILVSVYACFLLIHKRCVDILGKKEKSILMAVGLILAGLLPYVGAITGLYLLCTKGEISSPVTEQ